MLHPDEIDDGPSDQEIEDAEIERQIEAANGEPSEQELEDAEIERQIQAHDEG